MRLQIGSKKYLSNRFNLLNELYDSIDIFELYWHSYSLAKLVNHAKGTEEFIPYKHEKMEEFLYEYVKGKSNDFIVLNRVNYEVPDKYYFEKDEWGDGTSRITKFTMNEDKTKVYQKETENYIYTVVENKFTSKLYYKSKMNKRYGIFVTDKKTFDTAYFVRPFVDKALPTNFIVTNRYRNRELNHLIQDEVYHQLPETDSKNIFHYLYKKDKIVIKEEKEYSINTVTYDEKTEEVTLHLITSGDERVRIVVPKQDHFQFYVNTQKVTKSEIMSRNYITVSKFNVEITENINNRMKNYIYFLKNIHQFESLFRFDSPRNISIKDLISILYADKIEGMFAIYEKIESFKYLSDWEDEERVKYLNKVFELYDRSMLVRELKTSFVSTVPRAKLLFHLDSLEALTGIRLMQLSDTGNGIFNIISSFSTEELKVIGELFFELHFLLRNLSNVVDDKKQQLKRLYEYKENKSLVLKRYLKEFYILKNDFFHHLEFNTTFKSVEKGLREYIDVINTFLYREEDLDTIYLKLPLRFKHKSTFIDSMRLFFEIYPDRSFKDFKYHLNKDIVKYHDELVSIYNAISRKLEEEKYQVILNEFTYKEYQGENYSVLVPKNLLAIVNEGNYLSHCVAVYIRSVLRKVNFIVFLRKNEDLETPYITIEIRDKKIIQIKGYKNQSIDKDSEEMRAIKQFAKLNNLSIYDEH